MPHCVQGDIKSKYSKFLLFLLVTSIFGLISCNGDSTQRQAEHFERAEKFYDNEQYEKARIEVQNVLQLNDKHVKSLYLMGQIAEKTKDWQQAYTSYSLVAEEQPENDDAQIKIGQIYLLSGDSKKSREKLEQVLARNPEHIEARLLDAVLLLRDGKVEQSKVIVESVLTQHPNHIEATSLYSQLLVSEGKTEAALNQVDSAIKVHPDDKSLRFLKISLHRKLNQIPEAEREFKALIALAPDNDKLKYAFAEFYVSAGQKDNAEALLREMIKQDPDNTDPKLALIKFQAQFNSREKADQTLEAFIKDNPQNYKLRFALGELRQSQPDRAKAVYDRIVELDGTGNSGLEARVRLAQIAMQLQDKAEAQRLIDEVLAEDDEKKQALLIRASLLLDDKKIEPAIADLRTIIGNDPQFEPALRLLSVAYIMNGDAELARETLENAVKVDPKSMKSRYMLAGLMVKNNETDDAIELLEDSLKYNPRDTGSMELLTNVYIKEKQWDSAEKTAKALLSFSTKPYKANFFLGTIYQNQGKLDKAVSEYQQVLKLKPNNTDVLRRIVETYIAQNKPKQALKFLEARNSDSGNNANNQELMGEIFAWQKKPLKAEQWFLKAIESDPKLVVAYRQLARIYLQQKQTDKLYAVYARGLKAVPDQPDLLMELATLHQDSGNIQEAIKSYKKIIDKQPNSLFAVNNYAALIADTTDDNETLGNAFQLVQRFKSSDQAAFLDTYGWLSYRLGNYNEALPALEKAVNLAPDFVVFRYHLGMTYKAVNRDTAALRELTEAVSAKDVDYPGLDEAREVLDALQEQQG